MNEYTGVTTRFLRKDERLVLSEETDMPMVIEANGSTNKEFLQTFLSTNSVKLAEDVSRYGAVLFRGFDINSDEDFEKSILSFKEFRGINEAFMSEEGRDHVGKLKYVLHTNSVYKTGGTLYLGGFHSENYYGPDVPNYISFCCLKPSEVGGETGLINMEKIYRFLNDALKEKLEKNSFFVAKWLVSEVVERYHISVSDIEIICKHFDLPIVGEGDDQFILMYKPSVCIHPKTQKKSLQINLFEIANLNEEMRKQFMNDYQGKTWFWHRFVWKLPTSVLKVLEYVYIMFASFFHSPKQALNILRLKLEVLRKKNHLPTFNQTRVGECFSASDVKDLAKLIRSYYSSCLWKKGDILLIDNKQVMHAGMPGAGPRLVRAIIGNPLNMKYSYPETGFIDGSERTTETIGYYMTSGKLNTEILVSQSPTTNA